MSIPTVREARQHWKDCEARYGKDAWSTRAARDLYLHLSRRVRVQVRKSTYRGKTGYLVSGRNARGQRISIFATTETEARRIAAAEKAGEEWSFD